ncbi:MAG: AAA family ATPase [Aeromicrobium sp.]|uniref:AAA family ATPase n=1 Tax=Aeromicrobium sp. TaxID=1871063 RepID=UPI0039E52A3C
MLRRLHVERYRCFDMINLDLRCPEKPGGGWTVLVGENGTGKSSLLQAIVLGLMDPRPLTALNSTPWLMCRQGEPDGSKALIEVEVETESTRALYGKTVANTAGSYIDEVGEHVPDLPLMVAFSARRRIAKPGELPESGNREVERVRGLFDPNLPLLAHDAFADLKTVPEKRAFAKVVRDVIVRQLDSGEKMFPLVDAVELRGSGGVTTNAQLLEQDRFGLLYGETYQARVAVEDLSDGYQALLTIVLEILVQATLANHVVPRPETLRAIVLVDELEAHLHPRWQRSVIPLLREVFPQCQFIVTTHSPLVVGSAEPGEVQVLEIRESGDVSVEVLDERLQALDADEIYDAVFGVPRAATDEYVAMERAYAGAVAARREPDPEIARLLEDAWAGRKGLVGE